MWEWGVIVRPLLVRRVKLYVSKTGEITGSGAYHRSAKEVRNILEVEKRFSRSNVPLEQSRGVAAL